MATKVYHTCIHIYASICVYKCSGVHIVKLGQRFATNATERRRRRTTTTAKIEIK